MNKIYKIAILVALVFFITLIGVLLIESFNNNDPIASGVVVENNTTNKTYYNTTYRYIVKFQVTKNYITNRTIVTYYTPTYTKNNGYYTNSYYTYNYTYYTTNKTTYYYTTKPTTYKTYYYTYYTYG